MKPIVLIAFLVLNFLALGIGSFVANPAEDAIYQNLNRAPWTPPGWVFGVAWTVIMICFAFFMEGLYRNAMENSKLVLLAYAIQWVLNVSWNPIFFGAHLYLPGLLVLLALFAVLLFQAKLALPYGYGLLVFIVPYLLWMAIAISLNTYVVLNN
jgi:tryptophan-rich sensory protein